jgi:hypothetical protein
LFRVDIEQASWFQVIDGGHEVWTWMPGAPAVTRQVPGDRI